ncbi:hypothetical protein JCM3774_003730 [Rhodotorula dairenensis]
MPSSHQGESSGGGGGGKVRSTIEALKRLPLLRRNNSSERAPSIASTRRRKSSASGSGLEDDRHHQGPLPQPSLPRNSATSRAHERAALPSPTPSLDRSTAPEHKLNSASPASELPKSWSEWNWAYQNGYIDFDDPPPPPSDLWASDFVTQSGTFRPPRPANEIKRQRAVDGLGVLSSLEAELPTPPQSPTRAEEVCSPAARRQSQAFDDESANRRGDGSSEGSVTCPPDSITRSTKRQLGPLHPALQQLAAEAKHRFGVDATTVSLMSNDHQVFLSDSNCKFIEDTDRLERDSTCCAHTMLKASTTGTGEPLVVLDFSKDWRFRKNGFGPYDHGFYAAAPIIVPAPLGDKEAENYPAGVFCLLGEQPRSGFDERDRRDLSDMAERASAVIRHYVEDQRRTRSADLAKKQSSWRRNDKVRRARRARPGVAEEAVPSTSSPSPGSPVLAADVVMTEEAESLPPVPPPPVRVESVEELPSASQPSSTSRPPLPFQTSALAPVTFGHSASEDYQPAMPVSSETFDADVRDALDLSTELVANSIEMDFAYIACVVIPSSSGQSSGEQVAGGGGSNAYVEMISSYGRAAPEPQFSRQAHASVERADGGIILYIRNDKALRVKGEPSDSLTTGLLAQIATVGDRTYALGCFSQDVRRVLDAEDVQFVKSFARDLVQHVDAHTS